VVQTNIMKEYPLISVYSVGTVHYAIRFSWKSMTGVFNTFGKMYRIDCTTASLSLKDSSRHVGSPCNLYGKDFACLSKKTFYNCLQINEKTFKYKRCLVSVDLDDINTYKAGGNTGAWGGMEFTVLETNRDY
jgi:hypothetical protein